MTTRWNETSLAKYDTSVKELITGFSQASTPPQIHIGTSNSKTHMINEGTSAGLCGTCSPTCKGDCREFCYAIVHGDGVYKQARANHAENTVARRFDPIAYYEAFFAMAEKKHCHLRVNETGDFEKGADINALAKVAAKHPSVRVIGYTKREELLAEVAEVNALENVMIHFSLACNGKGWDAAKAHGVPVARITTNAQEGNCPFQIAKAKKQDIEWSCLKCAEKKCGCFSNRDIAFIAH